MTMRFQTAKAGLEALLVAGAAAGEYRVIGAQDGSNSGESVAGSNRLVQIIARKGDFPKGAGAFGGPMSHDVVVNLELLVSGKASADLAVLESATASDAERAIALENSQTAVKAADTDWDDFFDTVRDIVMNNENQNFGLSTSSIRIANRWVDGWEKDDPMTRGRMVIIAGTVRFGFRVLEEVGGETPQAATPGEAISAEIKTTPDEDGTPQGGAGVLVGG